MFLKVPFVSDVCFNENIGDEVLCAGGENTGEDVCQGDSGGPLVAYDDLTDRHYQVGVVSFGPDCNLGQPSGYADVQVFLDYILQFVPETQVIPQRMRV